MKTAKLPQYEEKFRDLMAQRNIESMIVEKELVDKDCLLCSEDEPDHCHRRLVAEYLREKCRGISIRHLMVDRTA